MTEEADEFLDTVAKIPSSNLPLPIDDFQDVNNMCRLCMSSKEIDPELDMVEISANFPNTNTPISQLFSEGLNIDTDNVSDSGMPDKVCVNCLAELLSYTNFRKRSLSVDAKLRQLVSRKKKIAEAQALYGPVFFDIEYPPHSPDSICLETFYREANVEDGIEKVNKEHLVESQLSVLSAGSQLSDIEETFTAETNFCTMGVIDGNQAFEEVCAPVAEDNCQNLEEAYEANEICADVENGVVTLDYQEGYSLLDGSESETPSGKGAQVTQCNLGIGDERAASIVEFQAAQVAGEVEGIQFSVQDVSCGNQSTKLSVHSNRRLKRRKNNSIPIPQVFVLLDSESQKQLAFRCSLCSEVFQSRKLYRKHAIVHVKDTGNVCRYCEKWFQTRSALARHERIHSGEKPFQCVLCDRCFSQKEILQRHVSTHTDTKPYQCPHCEKSYTQKEGLNAHVKHYHQAVREIIQYPCPLCDKAFCHPSGLSRHMVTHTGKLYVCEICDRSFTDASSLKRHSKSQHAEL